MTMAPDPHAPYSAPRWPVRPEPEQHIPLTPETAMVWRSLTKSKPPTELWTDLLVAGSLIAVATAAGVMILLT